MYEVLGRALSPALGWGLLTPHKSFLAHQGLALWLWLSNEEGGNCSASSKLVCRVCVSFESSLLYYLFVIILFLPLQEVDAVQIPRDAGVICNIPCLPSPYYDSVFSLSSGLW